MDRKRKLGLAAFLLVFITAACLLSLPVETNPLPSIKLPDGRTIQVEGISYGKTHEVRNGSDFLRKVQRASPRFLRGLFGSDIEVIKTTTKEDTLIPFLSIEPPAAGGKMPQWGNWHVVSENGEVFRSGSWTTGRKFNNRTVAYPRLPVFPRRDKSLTLTGTVDRLPFAISFPNPSFKLNLPTWTTSPIGTTNRHDGYEFVLGKTDLYVHRSAGSLRTQLAIYKDGKKVNNWFRHSFTLKDATGNVGYRIPTNEPAWKIAFELRREYPAPWHRTEYQEMKLEELPAATDYEKIALHAGVGGVTLQQLWIGGPGDYTMRNGVITNAVPLSAGETGGGYSSSSSGRDWTVKWKRDKPWMMFEVSSIQRGSSLSVFLVDSKGRYFTATKNGSVSAGGFRARHYDLKIPKDFTPPYVARFAVQTNIITEFIVDPAELERTGPKKRNR